MVLRESAIGLLIPDPEFFYIRDPGSRIQDPTKKEEKKKN
jgi:hypothetical protein